MPVTVSHIDGTVMPTEVEYAASACVDHYELRNDRRFDVSAPFELIPLQLDGTLRMERRVSGRTTEFSTGGLAATVSSGDWYSQQECLLVMRVQGQLCFTGIVIRRAELTDSGILIGAEFGGLAHQVIEGGNLNPVFDADQLSFVLPQSPQLLENWAAAGVVEKVWLDRVLVCPRCCGLPTVRGGCRKCGSGRVVNDRLMHHFACAYVGFVQEFTQSDGQLVCPKCRTDKLVVGADYEFLTGQSRCCSCGWRDSETEPFGHCLHCNWRFEMRQARTQDLYGYHVRRLDPLAVITDLV